MYEYKNFAKCPRCGRKYVGFPAVSRVDNKTEICSDCGVDESLICCLDLKNFMETKKDNWYETTGKVMERL